MGLLKLCICQANPIYFLWLQRSPEPKPLPPQRLFSSTILVFSKQVPSLPPHFFCSPIPFFFLWISVFAFPAPLPLHSPTDLPPPKFIRKHGKHLPQQKEAARENCTRTPSSASKQKGVRKEKQSKNKNNNNSNKKECKIKMEAREISNRREKRTQ